MNQNKFKRKCWCSWICRLITKLISKMIAVFDHRYHHCLIILLREFDNLILSRFCAFFSSWIPWLSWCKWKCILFFDYLSYSLSLSLSFSFSFSFSFSISLFLFLSHSLPHFLKKSWIHVGESRWFLFIWLK